MADESARPKLQPLDEVPRSVGELGWIETDQHQQFFNTIVNPFAIPTLERWHHSDVTRYRQMGKQPDLLNHITDMAS